ncbi:MAG TPA: glycosyltransferase [Pseudobdellovibrionaceae bacterium]|nr:glycosyltransferase [Pseudobdellovibrionaceae bacterium]
MDLVSIVIPSFNHEKFIKTALQSIFNQTYRGPIEIILVDDGSSDQTINIAKKLKSESSLNFQIIEQQNQGAHAAINHGLQGCNGNYVAILNSDDSFDPKRIEVMIEALKVKNGSFAFSQVNYMDENGNILKEQYEFANILRKKQSEISNFPSIGYALLESNISISTGNFFFKKSLFNKVGPFSSLRHCHDWDFILRSLFYTEPLYIDLPLYNYRLHGQNTYKGLTKVAAHEGPLVISNYLNSTLNDNPENALAPCSKNWPLFHNYFINKLKYEQYYTWKF